ncbi:MAG: 4Fe-4S dicluster domain-containing protein [Thermoplasmata archaeon]
MSIVDLTSMAEPEGKQKAKVDEIIKGLREDLSQDCYQCGKCTSGCEAFILTELEPHKVMALSKAGFIDELLNSEEIWTCVTCLKCKERCPQDLAPVDVIFAVKNIAVASGKQIHTGYSNMLQAVLGTGYIQKPKEVVDRDNEAFTRDSLGLPSMPELKDLSKMQQVLMKAATETLR